MKCSQFLERAPQRHFVNTLGRDSSRVLPHRAIVAPTAYVPTVDQPTKSPGVTPIPRPVAMALKSPSLAGSSASNRHASRCDERCERVDRGCHRPLLGHRSVRASGSPATASINTSAYPGDPLIIVSTGSLGAGATANATLQFNAPSASSITYQPQVFACGGN